MKVKEYYTLETIEKKHTIKGEKGCYHSSTTYAYVKDGQGHSSFIELCPYCGETDKDAFGCDY